MKKSDSVLVLGSSNPAFNEEVVALSNIPTLPLSIERFPDGEIRVHLKRDVAGKQAIVLQSLGKSPNEYLIETMLIADALRRAGAARVVLAAPYLAYSRQNLTLDSKESSASLAARLFAHFLREAGIDELVTMDLHAEHIPSFYDFPVRHLTARKVLADAMKQRVPAHTVESMRTKGVVVGPDLGSAKLVAGYANEFESTFALIQKRRVDAKHVESLSIVGDVKGKNVLLADDMCSTGVTMASAADVCCGKYQEKGAKEVEANQIFAVATHGLLVDGAMRRIEASPIKTLFVSNSVAIDKELLASPKLCVISVAPLFAAALSDL